MQVLTEVLEKLDFTKLEAGVTLYVHLYTGEVIQVEPATGVRVTEDAVQALDDGKVVATFPRAQVYLAADVPMEPPPLE